MLFTLWEESLQYVKETDMKSRKIGVKACMVSFDFLFGLMLGQLLLRHSDNLSQTLHSPSMSAAEGQYVAAMTVKTLQSLRSEENFAAFWGRVYQTASELEVEYPTLPCKRRPCRRYDSGSSDGHHPGNVQDMYRRIFFEVLDLTQFDQPGYQVYCKLENLLLKAANKENFDTELQFVTEFTVRTLIS